MWNNVQEFIETYIDLIDFEDWDRFLDAVVNEHAPLNNHQYGELQDTLARAGIIIPEQYRKDKFIQLLKFYLIVYEQEEEVLPICIFLNQYYDCRMGLTELECAQLIEENLKSINPKMALLDEFGSGNPTQYLLIFEGN